MSGRRGPAQVSLENSTITNAWLIAKREFGEKVDSRIFGVSTLLLAALAVGVSLTPVALKAMDRGTSTKIAISSPTHELTTTSITILGQFLNPEGAAVAPFSFIEVDPSTDVAAAVRDGEYAGGLVGTRATTGQLQFQFLAGESIGTDRVQQLQIGSFAIGIFDWIAHSNLSGAAQFLTPSFTSASVAAGGGAPETIGASDYAGRRIVGVVFVVLIFITLVIYGMWVAAGVVAEKSSRVMELLISAATPKQLILGKVIGIGLAGMLQYVAILIPAVLTIVGQDRIAALILGTSTAGLQISLSTLTPGLLIAYGGFWVLGFVLYALIYAAAGSLVSRAEDLQVLALPLSLVAIGGYFLAMMALSGGIGPLVRLGSYFPFWSPFVMLTRLTVSRVDTWELVLSYGLLLVAIPVVAWLAIRVYSAGVLLYGQRPGARAIAGAIVSPPA
ncbi:MAG TPA: ABC transporter permease [Candidatus Limnocylindrales bacterium]|nr:ABC transporter permease [Candidatus Limnocylindrales bacterium]